MLFPHIQSEGVNILQTHAVFSVTCNTKLAFLWTQPAQRKGWTGLDTNYYQKKKKHSDFTTEINLHLWEMKHVKVNTLSFLKKMSSHRFWIDTVQTSRQVSVTIYRNLSQCDLVQFWWWICCVSFYYACMWLKNPNEVGGKCVLSSTNHRFKPQRGFSYWPVSQCPLLAEKLSDNSSSGGIMTGNTVCE